MLLEYVIDLLLRKLWINIEFCNGIIHRIVRFKLQKSFDIFKKRSADPFLS